MDITTENTAETTVEFIEEETESIEISATSSDILEIEDNITISGTSDYEKLGNKPQINSIELIGNKTSDELNIQEKMSALTNLEILNLLN